MSAQDVAIDMVLFVEAVLLAIGSRLMWQQIVRPFLRLKAGQKRRDALWRTCYGQPTDNEILALSLEQREEDRLHILKAGRVMLYSTTNCALGSWGHLVICLESEGLMEWRPLPNAMGLYTITSKGRAYLKSVAA